MKKILLIGLILSLSACTPKKQPVVTEEFAPRETVEMEAVEEITPEPAPEEVIEEMIDEEAAADNTFEPIVVEPIELEPIEDELFAEEPVVEEIIELEPVEIPEEVMEDEIAQLEEETSELIVPPSPSNPRKLDTIKGDQISITYFFDYTSSNIAEIEDMIKTIGGKFGQSILWIYRPIGSFGSSAFAAKASECGRIQGAWPGFHEALISLEGNVTEKTVSELARSYPLNMTEFQECIVDRQRDKQLEFYNREAKNLKIESTPAFLIGEDVVFAGNYPPAFFQQMIQSFLSSRLSN